MRHKTVLGFTLSLFVSAGAQSSDPQSFQRNLQWAQMGQVQAEVTVGRDYMRGSLVSQDLKAARQWFSTASAGGATDADAWLAYMAIHGQGVSKDESGGLAALQKAEAAGSIKAKTFLAQIYESGKLVPRDMGKAEQLYKEASSAGDADAMAGLGNLYLRGIGVPRNETEGARLLAMSAAARNEWGEVFFANYLIANGKDIADQQRGVQLLRLAASQKNAEALFTLGTITLQGNLVTKDTKSALNYYKQAGSMHFVPAERELAAIFASGLGVDQNNSAAYYWSTIAAAQGDEKSVKLAETIKPRLSQSELASVQQLVIKFMSGGDESRQ